VAEPITIILQTWQRTDCAVRTIRAAREHLRYPDLRWYVADDGSRPEHVDVVLAELADAPLVGWHSERLGYGATANRAIAAAEQIGVLYLFLEDDWALSQPLDLWPYAALLMERDEIGMVRLGVLNLDIRGRTWGHSGRLYWTLDKAPHLEGTPVFTGHPSLRHRRYREAYGEYPTGLGPGDTELAYAYQYRVGPPDAPGIVWPADYPSWGLFSHIGEVKTETLL
jgi:GT2 family glycosyltransferase